MIKGPGRIPGFANLMDLSKISTKIKLSCHANLEIDSKQQKRKFIV